MSANTAIQLQFIQYCVVKIVEITELVDIGDYTVGSRRPSGIAFKVSLGVAIAVATSLESPKVIVSVVACVWSVLVVSGSLR